MVLEAACRRRVVAPEDMKAFRRIWGRICAPLVIDPLVMPSITDFGVVTRNFPERLRLQPVGQYRQMVLSNRYNSVPFARDLGGVVAAPPGSDFAAEIAHQHCLIPPSFAHPWPTAAQL